ncbi:aldo/keto reductase [Mycobacterium palustre]|uniref:NADP-dependent oxidoreductase domain-containing protein n=1 Tax=Mycobacterium palustre TaxID=153971 RepID=A0A1X1ZW43_9MYCO|nr:aldo/keto reductase [Mycobacterium palustre]ORW28278.1 hypothetical protein AWC19_27295 [Mycobacterium palustre]
MAELGAGLVPKSPLGRGFLTGAVQTAALDPTDFRARTPRFIGDAAKQNQVIAETVRNVAERLGVLPAQVALAWVYAQAPRLGVPSYRSLVPATPTGSNRTSPPWTSNLMRTRLPSCSR